MKLSARLILLKVNTLLLLLLMHNGVFSASLNDDQLIDSLAYQLKRTDISDSLRFYTFIEIAKNYTIAEPLTAQHYYDSAFQLLQTMEASQQMEAYFNWQQGNFFWSQSIYPEALLRYQHALEIYEELGDRDNIRNIYNNMGEVHKKLEEYDLSLYYLLLALKQFEDDPQNYRLALTYINLGELYILTNQADSAAKYLKRGRDMARRNRNNRQMAYSFQYLGDINLKKGFYLEALTNYQQSLVLWKARGNFRGEVDIYNRLAEVAILQGDAERAERYLNMAYEINQNKKYADLQLNTLKQFIALEKLKANELSKAIQYYDEYLMLRDSVFSRDRRDQLLKLQLQMDFAKLEKSNILLSKEKELAEEQLSMQNRLIIFVTLCLIIAVGLLYALFMQKKLTDKAQESLQLQKDELEKQQQENEAQAIELNKLNEQLKQLNKSLSEKDVLNQEEIEKQKKLIARYAYINAHKLRAPVASVIGLINLLEISPEGKVDPTVVNHLKKSAMELDEIVSQIRNSLAENFPDGKLD